MTDTINNSIPFVPENTIDPAAGLNLSLNTIDAILQIKVESIGDITPPAGVEGERHIVGVGATGDWVGQDNKIARYLNGSWQFYSAWLVNFGGVLYGFDGSSWSSAGTVTSVDMSVPTGLEISGNPVTTSGTLAVTYASGYSIPTDTVQALWSEAYNWGDHSLAGYQDELVSGTNIKTVNGNSLLGSGDLVISGSSGALNDLTDVTVTGPVSGEALIYNGSIWENQPLAGGGTVTSVDMSVPTGLEISGNPITSSGTLALAFDTGYTLVSGTDRSSWDSAVQPTGDTIDDVTITEYTEPVYTASTGAFDRGNGGIQYYTMTANESLTFTIASGQDMELHLSGAATYTVTWPAGAKWLDGFPPDLSTSTEAIFEVFYRGTTLYIAYLGDYL